MLESIFHAETITDYPKCIAGERACPFEDSGNIPGYERILQIISNPADREHQEMRQWVEIWGHYNGEFNPQEFDPKFVVKLLI